MNSSAQAAMRTAGTLIVNRICRNVAHESLRCLATRFQPACRIVENRTMPTASGGTPYLMVASDAAGTAQP